MGNIRRWVGGAGSGKTTLILNELTENKARLGLSVDQIGCCTFTRAGRQEISERAAAAWGCDAERLTRGGWFRTAHSIAYRQVGVEDGQLLQGEEGSKFISEALGGTVATRFDARSNAVNYVAVNGDNSAALSLKAWELARSRMTSLNSVIELWAAIGEEAPDITTARHLVSLYETAKRRQGRLDFTDMIARFAGVRYSIDGPTFCDPEGTVPEDLRVLAVDEAQDSSVLVDRVCRRLAESPTMDTVMLCGDPFQSIFGFGGSDYRLFMSWDAEERVMPRSYRCPPVVMEYGERCLRAMHSGYFHRPIAAATHDGRIDWLGSIDEAMESLDPTVSTLILGRVGYALEPYETWLKSRGIPYSWIDRIGSQTQLSGYSAFWSLANGEVVGHDDWQNAISMIAVSKEPHGKLLRHGEKKAWAEGKRSNVDMVLPVPEIMELAGCTPALIELIRQGRWVEALEPRIVDKASQWAEYARRYGPDVASNPKVRLSTIHSAKGCEGDTVILSTTSSPSVTRARMGVAEMHDEECRVNYVAVTRARRCLRIVNDGGFHRMELPV